jgi:hypothetical protein
MFVSRLTVAKYVSCVINGSFYPARIIMSPVELIKIQQQTITSRDSPLAKSALQVASRIYRRHGIRGLYRGVVSTALRDLGYGSYFAMVSDGSLQGFVDS